MVGATPCPPSRRKFDHAVTVVRHLPTSLKLQSDDRLKLYGLYKQASEEFTYKKKPRNRDWLSQAKWDSWMEVSHLTQEEAQEEYVKTLVEFLKSFPERQQAVDLVTGLERTLLLTDFQLGVYPNWPRTTTRTKRFPKSCSAELNQTKREAILQYCRDSAIYLPTTNGNGHASILTDNPLDNSLTNEIIPDQYPQYSSQIHLIHNQSFNDSVVAPESPISNATEIPDDCSEDSYASSDDGESLSTVTVRACNHRNYRSSTVSDRHDSVDSGLSSDTELALESLQTQVAALNQKIDLLKQDLRQTDVIRAPKPFWHSFTMDWLKTAALNFFVGVIILTQYYRIRSVHHRSVLVYYFSYFNACCRRFIEAGRKLISRDPY